MKYFALLFFSMAFFLPCHKIFSEQTESAKKDEIEYLFKNDAKKESLEQNKMLVLTVKMIVVLAITIAIAYAFAYVAKRFFGTSFLSMNKTARIQVIERKSVSPKAAISIIRIDDTEFCIAETQNSLTLLSKLKTVQKDETV